MTELTPLSEVQRLSRIVDELREAGDKLAEWERKAVRAREAYTVAFNLAYLAAVGPIPERKAQAENATHEERLRAEGSEAEVRIWRVKIRILEREVDVGRSNIGVLRIEANLA